MSKEIVNAYKKFLQYERQKQEMSSRKSDTLSAASSGRSGLLAPKMKKNNSNMDDFSSSSNQPIDTVVDYVQRIRKHRMNSNG